MFKLPMTIKHTGYSADDIKKLEVLFDNANRKFFDMIHQRLGAAAKNFKIYIDNQDPVPAVLQEKTVRATSASQNVLPDSGYDALSKVIIPAGIVLSSVAKTANPSTTTYIEGQVFSPTGMTGTATYSNSATKSLVATDFTCPTTPLTLGTTSVTVSYIEAGISKSFTVDVTVNARAVSSIEITTAPSKTDYTTGETLTMAGMVITATYNDETTATVPYGTTGITYSPAEGTTVTESGNVTVTYATKTDTQAITFTA